MSAFFQPKKPIVIAHRGASGYLPEHTLEAKAMAHALGADYLEQDLVLTKDNVPLVLHDIHIDTISDVATRFPDRKRPDGRYYALDFTLEEIKQLRVSERFNPATGKAVFSGRFPLGTSHFEVSTLEEELQLIQGLNKSTGRTAGIYPELKSPDWHRQQGHDISKIVLPILARYGYSTKADPCYLQCFELNEIKRVRKELGWKGRSVMLLDDVPKGDDGTDYLALQTERGVAALAEYADGIGPDLSSIVTGNSPSNRKLTNLVKYAHANHLQVHPYTHRIDSLPKFVRTSDELLSLLFKDAKIDGLFSDFTDVVVRWLAKH